MEGLQLTAGPEGVKDGGIKDKDAAVEQKRSHQSKRAINPNEQLFSPSLRTRCCMHNGETFFIVWEKKSLQSAQCQKQSVHADQESLSWRRRRRCLGTQSSQKVFVEQHKVQSDTRKSD